MSAPQLFLIAGGDALWEQAAARSSYSFDDAYFDDIADGLGSCLALRVVLKDGEMVELAAADVGLAPPRDDEFARDKRVYKSIQYWAAALPIVGSPVGTNRHVIDDDARARVRARLLPCSIEALLPARGDLYDRLFTRGRQR